VDWGAHTFGTIYELESGVIETLHSFGGGDDGSYIDAGLTQGADGNLYGVSLEGGTFGAGALFQLTLDGSYTKLYDFPVPFPRWPAVDSVLMVPCGLLWVG
jgi:uncharacterized repeat protein (TIGR03803 family)